jgi:hypothetical protein
MLILEYVYVFVFVGLQQYWIRDRYCDGPADYQGTKEDMVYNGTL